MLQELLFWVMIWLGGVPIAFGLWILGLLTFEKLTGMDVALWYRARTQRWVERESHRRQAAESSQLARMFGTRLPEGVRSPLMDRLRQGMPDMRRVSSPSGLPEGLAGPQRIHHEDRSAWQSERLQQQYQPRIRYRELAEILEQKNREAMGRLRDEETIWLAPDLRDPRSPTAFATPSMPSTPDTESLDESTSRERTPYGDSEF